MAYINCGAYVNGTRPATKKALKDAMKNAPDSVTFDSTSMFDYMRIYRATELRPEDKLSVCGPDPNERRNWYATVTADGKVS